MTAASLTLFSLLAGPPREARVVAVQKETVFLALDETEQPDLPDGPEHYRPAAMVALQRPNAVPLPIGIVLSPAAMGLMPVLVEGSPVSRGPIRFGHGAVSLAGTRFIILNWWKPTVVAQAVPTAAGDGIFPLPGLFNGFSEQLLARVIGGPDQASLAKGLTALSTGDTEAAVRLLIGTGEGLIPAGDNILGGALAALAAWGSHSRVRRTLTSGAQEALERTTAVSAALLRAAMAGSVVPPLKQLIDALGAGDLVAVHAAFGELSQLRVSSGSAMAAGVVHQLSHLMTTGGRLQISSAD
jgi:hypothetical protein